MILASITLPFLLQAAPSLPATPPQAQRPETHHLVVIRVRDAKTLDRIQALDLDLASCNGIELPAKTVEVVATDKEIQKIAKAGLRYRVAIRNMEDEAEKRLSKFVMPMALTPAVGKGAMGGHYTFAQIVANLDAFSKRNPKICAAKVSLGKSIQGRNIWMVKISDNVNVDENEPEVLFDALHHAREPLSATTTLLFMDWLIENYGKDPEATFLVDHRELYFVPCVNPDGYEYNRSIRPNGGGMWRKNRRKNTGGSYGVDLNRNYATGWTAPYGGNSTNPASSIYRGTKAFSEPETTALENFIKTRKFTVGCSCHTYTGILLYPWAYKRASPTNVADYNAISKEATRTSGISYGVTSQVLYIAAGGALDHYHAAHKMFGFSPELGKSSEGGFWPNPNNQVAIANRHQHMFQTFARVAGSYVQLGTAKVIEAPGGNNNGKVEPGEKGRIVARLDNLGAFAAGSPVILALRSSTTGITITKSSQAFQGIPKFSSVSSNSVLEFAVASSFRGIGAKFELELRFDGAVVKKPFDLLFANPVRVIGTDFEKSLGFARSTGDTARTGRFERAAPQVTTYGGRTYQPGSDHSPAPGTMCWVTDSRAGSSVGSYDVDSGHTSFVSPLMDLRHVQAPRLAAWIYYSESTSDDPCKIEVSGDGGSTWKSLFSRLNSTPGWMQVELPLTGVALTDKMRFRFWAQDLKASLVEFCVDDLEIRGFVDAGSLTMLGSGARGSAMRVVYAGQTGGIGLPLVAGKAGKLKIPGIAGELLLDPSSLAILPAIAYGSKARIVSDITIPNDSSLLGATLYWQQLLLAGKSYRFGNETHFQVR